METTAQPFSTRLKASLLRAWIWSRNCFKVRPRQGARKIWCFYWDPYRIALSTTVGLALLFISTVLLIFIVGSVAAGAVALFGIVVGALYAALLLVIAASGFFLGGKEEGGGKLVLGSIVVAGVVGLMTGSAVGKFLLSVKQAAIDVFNYMSGPALFTIDFTARYWLPLLAIILGPVILITTLAGLLMTVVGLMRAIEWSIMRIYGVRLTCPQCSHASEPAHYSCPDCGELHVPHLLPGPYGIFAHGCVTNPEHRLPTMMLLGRKKLPHTCGNCDAPMNDLVGTDKHIAFIGGRSSGKSSLLVQATRLLLQQPGARIPEQRQAAEFEQLERMLLQGETLPQTQLQRAQVEYRAFQVEIPHGKYPYHLHLYDIAGEIFSDPTEAAKYPFYRCLDALVFLIDPTCDADFCRRHGIPASVASQGLPPMETFWTMHHALEANPQYKRAKPQFFFMFAKTDLGYLPCDVSDTSGLERFMMSDSLLQPLFENARIQGYRPGIFAGTALGRVPRPNDGRAFDFAGIKAIVNTIFSTIKISVPI